MTQALDQFVALDQDNELAGGITYWSLSGDISLEALRQSLEIDGIEPGLLPWGPSIEQALVRAAYSAVSNKRQMVRQLEARGHWALVQETVVGKKELEYETLLVGSVLKVSKDEHSPVVDVGTHIDLDSQRGLAVWALREKILEECDRQRGMLAATDVSNWLIFVLKQLKAVSLRDRGGIYFVPRDQLPTWRQLTSILRAESRHTVFEIPAMKTEEAVEAILASVSQEMQGDLDALEAYLTGDTSTRGLNSWERQITETRGKLEHYVSLLGRALPDLSDRLSTLTGALAGAQLLKKSALSA